MSALTRQYNSPFGAASWQPAITQLLDEHHLVAWSEIPRLRVQFAASLGRFLQGLRDVEVFPLYGRYITDLESFCHQLERSLCGPMLERRLDGPRGVASLLRTREAFGERAASKFRFYLWHDADVLLTRDPHLFGQLVDLLAGVAAEAEYSNDDLLLIHRAVFVGGPALDTYAENAEGQFQGWASDGHGEPYWRVMTGIEHPPVLRYHIDLIEH